MTRWASSTRSVFRFPMAIRTSWNMPQISGYDWPLDGKHYGPGETPKVGEDVMKNPDLTFDFSRKAAPEGVEPIRFVGGIRPRH